MNFCSSARVGPEWKEYLLDDLNSELLLLLVETDERGEGGAFRILIIKIWITGRQLVQKLFFSLSLLLLLVWDLRTPPAHESPVKEQQQQPKDRWKEREEGKVNRFIWNAYWILLAILLFENPTKPSLMERKLNGNTVIPQNMNYYNSIAAVWYLSSSPLVLFKPKGPLLSLLVVVVAEWKGSAWNNFHVVVVGKVVQTSGWCWWAATSLQEWGGEGSFWFLDKGGNIRIILFIFHCCSI